MKLEISDWNMTVSYTHLDVYKRQLQHRFIQQFDVRCVLFSVLVGENGEMARQVLFALDAFCRQDVRTGKEKPGTDFVQLTVQ